MTDPLLVRALRGEPVERVPLWLMRQAGRYLPGYRALRSRHSMLDIARTPKLALEATVEPLERFELDAAIVFADITLPFSGLGVDFTIEPEVGPVVAHPVRDRAAVDGLGTLDAERDVGYVGETIRRFRELRPSMPILGFCGGPFTLAGYLVEGRPTRGRPRTRHLLDTDPATFDRLLGRLTQASIEYLCMQARAGASALQVFDTWAGELSERQYREAVLPRAQELFRALEDLHLPTIYFSTGSSHLLPSLARTGASALGVDSKVPLGQVRGIVGASRTLQGNLDPSLLKGPTEALLAGARQVLEELPEGRGHVFNLGHGVLPDTPPERVEALCRFVREYSGDRARHQR